MATQNQDTTSSKPSKRPNQNDSQIGGRTALTSPNPEIDRKDEFNKTDVDSRRTISPSTSDDVSSKAASYDSDDLDDGGMEYKASYDVRAPDVSLARENKTSPDWDKTQDPKLNVYGQSNQGGQTDKFSNGQDTVSDDSKWNNKKQIFNSDVKSDSKLDTSSQSSSPKKDNFPH
jgi:hypothetical protein